MEAIRQKAGKEVFVQVTGAKTAETLTHVIEPYSDTRQVISMRHFIDYEKDKLDALVNKDIHQYCKKVLVSYPLYFSTPSVSTHILKNLTIDTSYGKVLVSGDGRYLMSRYRRKLDGDLLVVVMVNNVSYGLLSGRFFLIEGLGVGRYELCEGFFYPLDDSPVSNYVVVEGVTYQLGFGNSWLLMDSVSPVLDWEGVIVLINGHQYKFKNNWTLDLAVYPNKAGFFSTSMGSLFLDQSLGLVAGDYVELDARTMAFIKKRAPGSKSTDCLVPTVGLSALPTLKEWILDLSAVFGVFGVPLRAGCSFWADSFTPKKNKMKVSIKPVGSLLVSTTPHYFMSDPILFDFLYNDALTRRFHFFRGRLVNYGPPSNDPYCLNTANNRFFKRQPHVVMPSTFVSGGVDMVAVKPLSPSPVKVVYNILVYDVLSELWCLSKNPSGLIPILSFSPVSLDYKKEVVDRLKKKKYCNGIVFFVFVVWCRFKF